MRKWEWGVLKKQPLYKMFSRSRASVKIQVGDPEQKLATSDSRERYVRQL